MKRGEIGCFLSHYMIWQEVISLYIIPLLLFKVIDTVYLLLLTLLVHSSGRVRDYSVVSLPFSLLQQLRVFWMNPHLGVARHAMRGWNTKIGLHKASRICENSILMMPKKGV